MITARTAAELRRHADAWRAAGERVAFVPTMGALHDGHLALVRRARELAPRTVVSIFVNPTQFNRADDLERYPRTPERDAGLLAAAGADLLFLPPVDEIYPPGDSTRVEVAGPAEGLEGAKRPGHFRGVATVVTRLFNLVQPNVAVFGEKDGQQLAVVRRMVRDLHQPVEIVGLPTVREADGLAMSSRNALLAEEDRRRAAVLYRALEAAREAVEAGERDADEVRRTMARELSSEPGADAEYADVVDAESFQPLDRLPETGRVVLPVAAWVGGVRLIDNLQLEMAETTLEPGRSRTEDPVPAGAERGADDE
jgi:pantoate--beta-alanine ligase